MKRIYLSRTDKKIFGFCGGLSEAFDIDSAIVRLLAIFICLITGIFPLVITYIVAGIITPDKPRD